MGGRRPSLVTLWLGLALCLVTGVGETRASGASTSHDPAAPGAPLHVRGTVVEASGRPVVDADVHVKVDGDRTTRSAQTRADGSFEIELPRPGSLVVSARAHRFTRVSWETVSQAPPGGVRIVLPRSAAISGRLADSEGNPAPGASVALAIQPSAPRDAAVVEIETQAWKDGQWSFSDVQPGTITLSARTREGDEALLLPPFQLREGDERTLDLRLEPYREHLANTIEGLVVDERGDPLPDIDVEVRTKPRYGRIYLSDAYGRFLIDGLEPGVHTVLAHAPGRMNVSVPDVRTGRNDLTIVVPPRGELVVRLVDRRSGSPILAIRKLGRTIQSGDGVFRIQLRDEGQKVDLVATGYEPVTLGPFERVAGRTYDAGTIALEPTR